MYTIFPEISNQSHTRDFSIPQNWHIVGGIPTKSVHISCFPELFANPFWLNSSLDDFPSTL
jgi:hypothetical protein